MRIRPLLASAELAGGALGESCFALLASEFCVLNNDTGDPITDVVRRQMAVDGSEITFYW